MTSKDTGASQDALINLIYRHLKDNGYKKAANVLRKHAPQVENVEVNTSLSNIFKKWSSERKRKKAGKNLTGVQEGSSSEISDNEASDEQTTHESPAKSKKVSTSAKKSSKNQKIAGVKTPSAGKKSPVDTKIRKTSGLKKQKNKDIKPRRKTSELSAGSVSDSDSSLDVEKWTKLVSQLSDADIEKMKVLSNFVESPISLPVKSTEIKKRTRQTKPKKETNLAKNGKSRTTAKKAGATGNTDAAKTSLKKPKAHKPAADHQTNGLVMTTPSTCTEAVVPSDSQNNRTLENVTVKSNSLEIPKKAIAETSETSSSETPSKKSKRKKVQTSSGKTDNHQKNANKPPDAHSDTILMSDQSETPSKKAKNKKSKSVVEPSQTPKTSKAKKTDGLVDLDTTTSEKADVLQESSNIGSPCKENKLNEGESFSETPSKKSKKAKNVIAEPDQLETPSKKPELESSDANLLQSTTKGSLKKRKSKSSSNSVETDHDGQSGIEFTESPIKKRKSQATDGEDVGGDGLNNEETSSQDLKTPSKKKKREREEANDVLAQEETTPEPKKAKKEKQKNKDENAVEDLQQPPEAVLVTIATDQKKKKKKKEKEREDEEIDDDPSVAEEVTVHKKKKKSSKEKHHSDEAPGLDTEQ